MALSVQEILTGVMDKVVKPLHQRFTGNDKGDLSGLKTADKRHFVAALNELKDQMDELSAKASKIDELSAKVLKMQEEFRDKKKSRRNLVFIAAGHKVEPFAGRCLPRAGSVAFDLQGF